VRIAGTARAALAAAALTGAVPAMAQSSASDPGISWNSMPQQSGADCSPSVRQQQQAMQVAQIDGSKAVANQFYDILPPGSFSQMSCLDRMLGGLNIIFNPPNLEDLLKMLADKVCNMAMQQVMKDIAPLSQRLNGALPLGQVIPGLNLGSLGMGASVSPSFGNANGSLVNTNINSVLRQPFGFSQQQFPGLFGNGSASGSNGGSQSGSAGLFGNTGAANSNGSGSDPLTGQGLY
jgi:hypothetical protein